MDQLHQLMRRFMNLRPNESNRIFALNFLNIINLITDMFEEALITNTARNTNEFYDRIFNDAMRMRGSISQYLNYLEGEYGYRANENEKNNDAE